MKRPGADEMIATLRARGLRITPQRVALVEAFALDASHPTAQELFERLRDAFPSMSFATVYNTLDALAQAGLSSTLQPRGAARFDPNTTPHHHAVCDVCGAAFDIPARTLEPKRSSRKTVSHAVPGFTVRQVERTYRGTCAACHHKQRSKEN
jgi:Fe2+ or Zn2+ uptake regulation protein